MQITEEMVERAMSAYDAAWPEKWSLRSEEHAHKLRAALTAALAVGDEGIRETLSDALRFISDIDNSHPVVRKLRAALKDTTHAGLAAKLLDLISSDDHERLCQGREYSCSCGYDERKDAALAEAAATIERLVAERDEALKQAEWWKKCDWWEGGQHDYHRSRATRLEAGLLKLRPGNGTDTERLAAIEQETGLSFTPKLTTHLEPHPAEAQRDKLKEALKPFADAAESIDDTVPDRAEMWEAPAAMETTAGDFRRARQALKDAP